MLPSLFSTFHMGRTFSRSDVHKLKNMVDLKRTKTNISLHLYETIFKDTIGLYLTQSNYIFDPLKCTKMNGVKPLPILASLGKSYEREWRSHDKTFS